MNHHSSQPYGRSPLVGLRLHPRRTLGARLLAAGGAAVAMSAIWAAPAHGLDAEAPDLGVALEPPISSPFGPLQYDNTPHCGAGVEVAYVTNRIIVQANVSSSTVLKAINSWLSATPAAGPASAAGLRSAPAAGDTTVRARLVDTITMPTMRDHGPAVRPVWAFSWPERTQRDPVALARHLTLAKGWRAAPDYVVRMHGHDFFKPDGLPTPTTETPVQRGPVSAASPQRGEGVRITVYDTGLAGPGDPVLMPKVRRLTPADVEDPDSKQPGIADNLFVGHGRAISSHIATFVPGALISNAKVTKEGISTDFSSAKRIVTTLKTGPGTWPNLLVEAFGTQACDLDTAMLPGEELMPVSLHAATEVVDRLSPFRPGEMLIVAAAGNHGTQRREYPAAFDIDTVVAVGALDATLDTDGSPLASVTRTAPVAEFSARGSWVDLYAPGQAIVALHVDGITFATVDADGNPTSVLIDGRAIVQGTSFSAPTVAGQIAELMGQYGDTAPAAAMRLFNSGVVPLAPCDKFTTQRQLNGWHGRAVALTTLTSLSDAAPGAGAGSVC